MKHIFLLTAILLSIATNTFAEAWTGSTSEPENMKKIDGKPFYVITNADELAWFAAMVNAGDTTINAVLANDIVFGEDTSSSSNIAWTTINVFDGIIDGNGFTIYGIFLEHNYFINRTTNNSSIKNLSVKNFKTKRTLCNGGYNGRGWDVCGTGFIYANNGTIYQVRNYNDYSDIYSGGITGYNYGKISYSVNYGKVLTAYGAAYNSYEGTQFLQTGFSGGIAGLNSGEIEFCSNTGSIVRDNNQGDVGGLVGKNDGRIINSTNNINVSFVNQNEGSVLYSIQNGKAALVDKNDGIVKSSFNKIDFYYFLNNTQVNSTAEKMQTDQFAWILNTSNGTEENSGIWSRGTDGYPIWANEDSLAIRKVIFDDDGTTSNRYTNYKGLVTFPEDPEPAEGYIFSGWYNANDTKVKPTTVFTADQTVKAVYTDASDVYWTINFYNAAPADTLLETKSYQHGSIVTYGGAEPTLTATAKYTYKFKGWDVEPTNAVENFDYHAVYDSTIRSYTIVFNNSDGSKIENATFEYGKMPSCSKTPTRTATVEWKYTHKGWKPALDYVTEDASYTAIYDSVKVEYKVTFMNGVDVIDEQMVPYGDAAVAPTDVTREGYKFVGWNTSFAKVTDNLTVKALFEEILESSSSVVKSSSSSAVVSSSSSKPASSSSAKSSSSTKVSSSSSAKVSSSSKAKSSSSSVKSSSSKKSNALVVTVVPKFSVVVLGRNAQIANAKVGAAFALFDMQGKVLMQSQVLSTNFNIAVPRSGNYLLRIGDRTQRVTVK